MWYFTWVLGIGFAVAMAILNALWGEYHQDNSAPHDNGNERTN